ncbi:MAG TPA: SDR family NAD(P)-dependent oxidoreductase [Candidatus Lustribacter sp.]|nr:SDR family NAD(P)-dependent oxidoreductase [Candidatus Lustribacter sp.]
MRAQDQNHVPAGRLAGKTALITGTAGGQGRAAAILFAAQGAQVVGCDIEAEGAAETVELVRNAGGTMHSQQPVDLSDRAQVEAWIAWAASTCGGFDILYNNAAAMKISPMAKMTPDEWTFTMRNELDIVYHACQVAWPHLLARRGNIINTASALALYTRGDGYGAHAAAKAGVISLTRQLAREGGPHGIRANSISPGLVETPITMRWLKDPAKRLEREQWYPLGRLGKAEDVAYAALYLASDEASWVTGSNLVIDGGSSTI